MVGCQNAFWKVCNFVFYFLLSSTYEKLVPRFIAITEDIQVFLLHLTSNIIYVRRIILIVIVHV